MKLLVVLFTFISVNSFANTYRYAGVSGKILNLSEMSEARLEFKANIFAYKGSKLKKTFSYRSSIGNDGSFEIAEQKVSCRGCKFSVRHYILLEKLNGKKYGYDVGKVTYGDNSYKKYQEYSIFSRPTFQIPLKLKDGRTVEEWFKSNDRPLSSIEVNITVTDGELVKPFLNKTLYTNGTGVVYGGGRDISLIVREGLFKSDNLKTTIDISLTEGTTLTKRVIPFQRDSFELAKTLEDIRLDISNLPRDMNGSFEAFYSSSTFFKKDQYGHQTRIRDKDIPTIVKLLKLSSANVSCSGNNALIDLKFEKLESAELTGVCRDQSTAVFEIGRYVNGKNSLAVDLRGAKFVIENTFLDSIYAYFLDASGKKIVAYNLRRI